MHSSPSAAATRRRAARWSRSGCPSARRSDGRLDGATSRASRTTGRRWTSSAGSRTRCRSRSGRRRGWAPRPEGRIGRNTLPFMHRRVGAAGHGRCSPRTAATTSSRRCERVPLDVPVYDINVEGTHNFIADGPDHAQLRLRLPRSGHHEHPQLPGRLRGRPRGQARAELPLDADDPERRQRGRGQQPRADEQGAVDRHRRGRSDPGAGAGRRARRGAVRGGGDRADGRRGREPPPRSRSSTGPTRSRGCWRTCWSARRSATR